MTDPRKASETHGNQVAAASPGELDPQVQAALGRALQAHYDDLVKAPIPDRFLVLLAELEAKESGTNL